MLRDLLQKGKVRAKTAPKSFVFKMNMELELFVVLESYKMWATNVLQKCLKMTFLASVSGY